MKKIRLSIKESKWWGRRHVFVIEEVDGVAEIRRETAAIASRDTSQPLTIGVEPTAQDCEVEVEKLE